MNVREAHKRKVGLLKSVMMIAGAMIGTGIFIIPGLHLKYTTSLPVIYTAWITGSIVAFSGANAYSFISQRFPKNGGEAAYFASLFSPFAGKIVSIVMITFAFAAPVSINIIAIVEYIPVELNETTNTVIKIGLLACITILFLFFRNRSFLFQSGLVIFTITLIVAIVFTLLINGGINEKSIIYNGWSSVERTDLLAYSNIVLIVYYSFTGWNNIIYVAKEVENPRKTIFKSMLIAVSFVTILYLVIVTTIYSTVSLEKGIGHVNITLIAITNTVSGYGEIIFSVMIIMVLLASVCSIYLSGIYILKTNLEVRQSKLFDSYRAAVILFFLIVFGFILFTKILVILQVSSLVMISISLTLISAFWLVSIKKYGVDFLLKNIRAFSISFVFVVIIIILFLNEINVFGLFGF